MTFRPSDDVLEQMTDSQNPQAWISQYNTYNNGYDGYNGAWGQYWQQNFQQTQNFWNEIQWNYTGMWNWESNPEAVLKALNIPIEEVKAPDLSDLLQNSPKRDVEEPVLSNTQTAPNNIQTTSSNTQTILNNTQIIPNSIQTTPSNAQAVSNNIQSTPESGINSNNNSTLNVEAQNISNNQTQEISQDNLDLINLGISDVERTSMVKMIEWSISSNLDFLVDEQWANAVAKYKKIYRILFKWWCLAIASITWLCIWAYTQIGITQVENINIIKASSIHNKVKWNDNTPDIVLGSLADSWVDLNVIIPYGTVYLPNNSTSFQSKSNLIKYKWIVLPQLISIDYDSWDIISLKDFSDNNVTRKDIENLVQKLVTGKYSNRNLNSANNKWEPNKFNNIWLIEWFSLWCINKYKFSDLLCDKFINSFYEFGKYYELSDPQYSAEILTLTKNLIEKWKDIEPICKMINEYVLKVGIVADEFETVMQFCNEDEYKFYKNLVDFIELENSLLQPELSDKVFDNADLNAYKLLSAQQTVYKIVWWTTLNENFLKSYLNYVQALLNKDNKTSNNRYIAPIYKDMLYVFNTDYVYQKVLQNWKSDIKVQLDQINNGNIALKYSWLISQLRTPDIVDSATDLSGVELKEVTIEEIFSQYYSMKDRLRIRSVDKISDNELLVKTELFTNKILSVTDDETLKLTVSLRRNANVLYVSDIKVTDQPKLSEILNIQASKGNTSFNAMLGIIDEQIGMWYNAGIEEDDEQPTFCEILQEREDISIYECDDSVITLYKWDVEYNFELNNWVLNWYQISDDNLDKLVHDRLDGVMFMRENTPTIITSIIDFTVETKDDSLEKKLEIIDQFRIHFKLVPNVSNIEWETDKFLVDFTLWTFNLQARYDMNTHLLTNISYVDCDKILEIRSLEIPITTENESQLIEISNNPQAFFTQINPAAYKKYQKMCDDEKEKNK